MLRWCLLANADLGRAFTRYSKRSSSWSENWYLIVAVLGIALFWIALYFWDRYRKQIIYSDDSEKALFLELCRAHKLNRAERKILLKAVQAKSLQQPAILFVDPTVLLQLAFSNSTDSASYTQLSKRLFGTLALSENERAGLAILNGTSNRL